MRPVVPVRELYTKIITKQQNPNLLMSFSIQFSWRNKTYSALVNEQRVSNVQLWIAEFSNSKMYILSKSRSGWCCDELKEELSRAIGHAIEQEINRQPVLKPYDA